MGWNQIFHADLCEKAEEEGSFAFAGHIHNGAGPDMKATVEIRTWLELLCDTEERQASRWYLIEKWRK